MKLSEWFAEVRGRSLELAKSLGVSQAATSDWATQKKGVAPARCVAIETYTQGQVTRRDLRPHDWGDIWPNLIDAIHPWPPAAGVTKATGALPIGIVDAGKAFAEIDLGPLPPHAANDSVDAPAPERA